jgi:hypothetical protein
MALTSLLLQSMLPQSAVKASGTSRASSTTLTADPVLTVPVVASATYDVELSLLYNGAATGAGDLKYQWSVPSGATFAGWSEGITNPLGVGVGSVTASSVQVSYGNGTGNPLGCKVSGTLFMSTTGGNLVLTWAQNTSNATATTLMAGCKLVARRTS